MPAAHPRNRNRNRALFCTQLIIKQQYTYENIHNWLNHSLKPYQVRTNTGISTVFLRYIYGRFTVLDRRSTVKIALKYRRTAGPGAAVWRTWGAQPTQKKYHIGAIIEAKARYAHNYYRITPTA